MKIKGIDKVRWNCRTRGSQRIQACKDWVFYRGWNISRQSIRMCQRLFSLILNGLIVKTPFNGHKARHLLKHEFLIELVGHCYMRRQFLIRPVMPMPDHIPMPNNPRCLARRSVNRQARPQNAFGHF